jgi:hypothetical protein
LASVVQVNTGQDFRRGSSKEYHIQVWFQLAQWFLRRIVDGQQMPSDSKSSRDPKIWYAQKKIIKNFILGYFTHYIHTSS